MRTGTHPGPDLLRELSLLTDALHRGRGALLAARLAAAERVWVQAAVSGGWLQSVQPCCGLAPGAAPFDAQPSWSRQGGRALDQAGDVHDVQERGHLALGLEGVCEPGVRRALRALMVGPPQGNAPPMLSRQLNYPTSHSARVTRSRRSGGSGRDFW